jgi:DNA-binding GntR family transcriptional regulator
VPASAITALDRVTVELRRRVESGIYRPGADLPSSVALAADMSVSPATVRQALARLDAAGLTRGRRGRPRIAAGPGQPPAATRYEQLAQGLRDAIAAGQLRAGGRTPTESTLATDHQVSRATARHALQLLETEGTIVQRAGRRYVAGEPDVPHLAYERVAKALRRIAVSNPGARLPGELRLAAEYGVSRPTIRRALELLLAGGLVRSEPKVGWYATTGSRRGGRRG